MDLLAFKPYNIDDNVCKRLENLDTKEKLEQTRMIEG